MSRSSLQKVVLTFLFLLFLSPFANGESLHVLEEDGVSIHYEPSLNKAAHEVIGIYPVVEDELWSLFNRRPEPRPSILITEGKVSAFGVEWEKTPISAFALPGRHLAVLNWERVGKNPLRLHDVLKHEVCHILLHQRIGASLPRWLDEGVCQWASDGISELLAGPRPSRLNDALSDGSIIPLKGLETRFPDVENDLFLAYEESKGFVIYLVNRFGKSGLIRVLDLASEGHTVRDGLLSVTGETLDALEKDWLASLKGGSFWLAKIGHYLYEILFGVMALLAVWGFMRQLLKKRTYRDGEPADEAGRGGHSEDPWSN